MNTKMERQIELEQLMQTKGVESYQRVVKNAQNKNYEGMTKYGLQLMQHSIDKVKEEVKQFLTKKTGKKAVARKYIKKLDPEVVAFIGLQSCLDSISGKAKLLSVASTIGQKLEDEIRFKQLQKEDPDRYKATKNWIKYSNNFGHKHRVLAHAVTSSQTAKHKDWPNTDRVLTGEKVIDLVIKATGLVRVQTVTINKKKHTYLVATENTRAWIDTANTRNPLYTPQFLPCVIPPRDWTTVDDGGYHTDYVPQQTLVKANRKEYIEELRNRTDSMKPVYQAINAMQKTKWRINKTIYEIMSTLWQQGQDIGGLPPREDKPLPVCPICKRTIPEHERKMKSHPCFHDEKNKEEHTKWKQEAGRVHQENAQLWSKRMQTEKILWVASLLKDEEEIYFPFQLDFRGRAYAIPHYLQPQGEDKAKALLEFAEGKKITTKEGEKWLAIHGANLYGNDKCSLEERHEWAKINYRDIKLITEDPYVHNWWIGADKPFQFLSWAFDWVGYCDNPDTHLSHTCVAMDGSCNGLQHFSAMLRDEEGAKAVNLRPSDTPQDIYQLVADKVTSRLNEILIDPESDDEDVVQAQRWKMAGVSRKVAKRPVMVLPYGGTLRSCQQYVTEAIYDRIASNKEKEKIGEDVDPIPWASTKEINRAGSWLSKIVWEQITDTVTGARHCMDWLKSCVRALKNSNLPVIWTTPTGFIVQQAYPDFEVYSVRTHVGDSIVKLSLYQEKDRELNDNKQVTGISPNFVHSLDASAMCLAITYAMRHGVKAFGMVHDSYGTHADDAPQLASSLRQAFVDMYQEHDVLQEFRNAIEPLLPEGKDIPNIPEKGNFDLAEVLRSDFFFA